MANITYDTVYTDKRYERDSKGNYKNLTDKCPEFNKITPDDDLLVQRYKLVAQEAYLNNSDKDLFKVGNTGTTGTSSGEIVSISGNKVSLGSPVYDTFSKNSITVTEQDVSFSLQNTDLQANVTTLAAAQSQERVANRNRNYAALPHQGLIDCYITNLLTNTTIIVQVLPDSLSDAVNATFDDVQTRGRTSPYKAYANSGPRTISFSLELFDDYLDENIVMVVRKLQALCYPTKSSTFVNAPKCRVKMGEMFAFTGVCNSVSVDWQKDAGFKYGRYSHASVSLDFNEVEDTSRYASEWESNFQPMQNAG